MIYFKLDAETIKENCNFKFYYNKTDITPTVLDGGNDNILVNCPNDKHMICNINNDTSHPYVLVKRSVLCNCGIGAENHFLLKSFGCMQKCKFKIDNVFYSQYSFCKLSRLHFLI